MPSQGEVLLTCQNTDEDIKNVVVIGQTGSGKSSLLNTLSGQKETFIVSASGQSVTSETVAKLINWRNSQKKVNSIDTPGLADSLGRDSIHIVQMVAQLKKQKKIDAFFIVLNGKQTRFDLNIKAMLKLFREIFGDDFINNTAIVLTNWEQSSRAQKERKNQCITEEKKCGEINLELKEIGFQPLKELPCFFVDNLINTMSQEEIIEDGLQKELEHLDQQVEKLGGFVQSQKPFICQDIKECLTQNDKLKKQIEDMEAENQEKDKQQKEEKEQLQKEMEEQKIQAQLDKEKEKQKFDEEFQRLKIEKEKEFQRMKIKSQKEFQEQQEQLKNANQQIKNQCDQHQKCIENIEKKYQEEKQKNQEEQQKSELLNQEKIRQIEEEKEKIKNSNEEEMEKRKLEFDKHILQIKEDQKFMQNKLFEEQKKQSSQMDALIQVEKQKMLELQKQQVDNENKKKKLYQKQVQEILDRPPAAGKKILILFNAWCRETFLRYGQLDIEKYNGKYVMTEFDQDETSIKKLEGIQFEWENKKYQVAYHGMVNQLNLPHGWGRAIYGDESGFVDGQWLNGQFHGIVQYVGPREGYERAFYKYGHLEQSEVIRNW